MSVLDRAGERGGVPRRAAGLLRAAAARGRVGASCAPTVPSQAASCGWSKLAGFVALARGAGVVGRHDRGRPGRMNGMQRQMPGQIFLQRRFAGAPPLGRGAKLRWLAAAARPCCWGRCCCCCSSWSAARLVHFALGVLQSCHIMEPYYQSWQESSHNDVACIECHFAAGLRRQDARQDAGPGAIGQVRHRQRRPAAVGRNPRRQLPPLRLPRDPAALRPRRFPRRSTSTTRRTWASSAAASSCAAPVATARSCRASTWR